MDASLTSYTLSHSGTFHRGMTVVRSDPESHQYPKMHLKSTHTHTHTHTCESYRGPDPPKSLSHSHSSSSLHSSISLSPFISALLNLSLSPFISALLSLSSLPSSLHSSL